MIIITGANGFIGSCLVSKLNQEGFNDLVLVDAWNIPAKENNLRHKKFTACIERENFFKWLDENHRFVQFIFHIGAKTDTTLMDVDVFNHLNLHYTQQIWNKAIEYGLPVVYASSAATYGAGEWGYKDSHEIVPNLKPLNPYGESKNDFDKWALTQEKQPYFWAGLKFFNVYGPNEYHKGRMASVVFHAFNQIKEKGSMKLFRSHHPNFKDGEQLRDFVYVKDVVEVCYFLLHHRKNSGLYNLGSGKARTFNDLVTNTFKGLGLTPQISYIDTPLDIRANYQYFTEADMSKLKRIGYAKPFHTLEEGIADYVSNYLIPGKYY